MTNVVSKLLIDQNTHDSRIMQIAKNFLNPDNFPFVVFNITEEGPNVTFKDTKNEILKEDKQCTDAFLQSLAISYISAIGQGHNYTTGVFELPAGNLQNYRLMIISVNLNGTEEFFQSYHQNYIQIGIFIPIDLIRLMPSLSSIEEIIMESINYNIPSVSNLGDKTYFNIKNDLMTIIFLSIIRQNFSL